MTIEITPHLRSGLPALRLVSLESSVEVRDSAQDLLNLIGESNTRMVKSLDMAEISSLPNIKAAKDAYRALGKDPSRYRPSAESLLRRLASGKDLFFINNVIDILNLISIETGISIGGYDGDRVEWPAVLDTGRPDEPYEGLGRGLLNIEKMPVLRDRHGPFGSPTSDSVRSSVTAKTTHFVMVFFDFGAWQAMEDVVRRTSLLLEEYAGGASFKTSAFK
jgi:DNA/RNA-binding domain of Phe-tRNA-synthetase-like protein